MNELRVDPLTGQQVLIAADRSLRPQDFVRENQAVESRDKSCPFCAGHEQETPPTVAESCDDQGNWQVRVVPNKYPAVTGGLGTHEVIIESPDHITDPAELEVEQWVRILTVQRERLRYWLADKQYQSVALFKNAGPAAGASLAHVHSQFTAFQFLPRGFAKELRGADVYRRERGDCYFSAAIAEAQSSGDRLVLADENFTLLCPYAARLPYETWILPNEHQSRFEQASDEAIAGLAGLLPALLKGLDSILPDAAYNLMLHTAPAVDNYDESFCWHWKLLPRTSRLAGLELGSGVMINSVAPELAAERLRVALEPPISAGSAT